MIDRERIKKRAKLIRPLLIPLTLYIGLLYFAVIWAPENETSPWRYLVVLLPMLPGIWVALGVVQVSSKLDDLEQRILLESAAFSFILTLLLLLSLGLLNLVGGPQLSSINVVLIMCVCLVVGKFWGNWRYR
ncbi:MAG: hypothetical protein H8D34_06095 [Chloroflexi bacterium]|nr:hypothetical protein [Chloroflexota bacterium]